MASTCGSEEADTCRNTALALKLKYISIASILAAGLIGVLIPLIGKRRKFLSPDGNLFVAAKAFAAGVILATGFVHMLSDGSEALSDPCLPEYPWSKFPFSGFFAMMSALVTLLIDFVGTQYYETRKGLKRTGEAEQGRVGAGESNLETGIFPVGRNEPEDKVFGEEENGGMHIVGMHAHAAHHRHNHPHGKEACQGIPKRDEHGHGHGHVHSHASIDGDEDGGARHVVVSQILELGIISHSVIIGLSLGVSQRPCTIRPLTAALSFHQFFEGVALGGCISQANFKTLSTVIMAGFFAITTPAGIAVGAAIGTAYDADSARALIIEGILDCFSAGILVYMALVDLIATDFLSRRMSCNLKLQVWSYVMLFLGAGLMSALAIWA